MPIPQTQHITLHVVESHAGQRLDVFVADSVEELTRSQVKRLITDGMVRLGGKVLKPSFAVEPGQLIEVNIPPPEAPSLAPENIRLDVLYEDSDIIVVNKAAGMVVHPAQGASSGTLVNALLAHCADLSGIGGELKPGIVHRLDKGTSGVIVVAKNDQAHVVLAKQFMMRTVGKIYQALVYGPIKVERGAFDSALGRSKRDRKRISSRTTKGRTALTEWRVLERFGPHLAWVEIKLMTGRTHQIRVHFAEAGHPLVGYETYGGKKQLGRLPSGPLRKAAAEFSRPALHAYKLSIIHPKTGERMEFTAPLPDDIEGLRYTCREWERAQR